jgi:hypothetical protein
MIVFNIPTIIYTKETCIIEKGKKKVLVFFDEGNLKWHKDK